MDELPGICLKEVGSDSQQFVEAAWNYMLACKKADNGFTAGLGCLESFNSLDEARQGWVKETQREALGEDLPEGWVPAVQYYALNQSGQFVGMIQLRLDLNEALRLHGGNIGYSVHPQFRRRGFARYMLQECLRQAHARGLGRVLITCSESNVASQRTILSCGGVFENSVDVAGEGVVYRYWVEL